MRLSAPGQERREHCVECWGLFVIGQVHIKIIVSIVSLDLRMVEEGGLCRSGARIDCWDLLLVISTGGGCK